MWPLHVIYSPSLPTVDPYAFDSSDLNSSSAFPLTSFDQYQPLDDAIQWPCSPHAPSEVVNLYMQDFITLFVFYRVPVVFSAMSEENSKAEGDDPPAFDSSKGIILMVQIHVSSIIHEALMPHDPCAALHTNKHSESGTNQRVSVSKDKNIPEQKIEDIFVGITSNMVYQNPNPQLKHS